MAVPSRAVPALLFFAALATAAAAAADVPPADTRADWTVGISVFRGEGLDPADAWFAWSVPLALRDRLGGLSEHLLDEAARADLARRAIETSRAGLLEGLSRRRSARDAAALEGTPQALAAAEAALAEDLAALARLDGLTAADVAVADRKPIAFRDGDGPGMLLAAPLASRGEAAARADVDLLVGGSVREAAGYVVVDVWAWDTARGDTVFAWRDAALREELSVRLEDAGDGLAELLLGRPWAALAVSTDPAGATVLVDGRAPAGGRTRFDELAPGTHEVRVSAPGRREEVRTVDLAPRTVTTLAVTLAAVDHGTITVASDPPGAAAWLDAVWLGLTPLEVPRPAGRSFLEVALPGGPAASLVVGPDSPAAISLVLATDAPVSETTLAAARDGFYAAFGWMVISLPVPFYTYAWAVDWAGEARRLAAGGDAAGAERAADIGNAFYLAYLGGLAASVSLAAWTIYRVVRYVGAADRPAAPGTGGAR